MSALRSGTENVGTCPNCGTRLTCIERPGLILDPFLGSGTTALAARAEGFRCIGVDSNEDYCRIAVSRLETPLDAALAEASE